MATETATPIRRTFVALTGICEIGLPDVCETEGGTPGPLMAVWDGQGRQIDVCQRCLAERVRRGEWVEAHRYRATGVVLVGVCEVAVPGVCRTEDGTPRPITAVWEDVGKQVNVCSPCLAEKVRRGEWVPGEPFCEPIVVHGVV
jgi:hypothetical protein